MASAPDDDRRAALLGAAMDTFLRYGFKKTSMDLVARAAGLSRQGVYLQFSTKEELFREAVKHFIATAREGARRALDDEHRSAEERVLAGFAALHELTGDSEHMDELTATAAPILGSLLTEFERGFIADLTHTIEATGISARWRTADVTAKALADHLYSVHQGLKHRTLSANARLDRMRTAVKLVCRGLRS